MPVSMTLLHNNKYLLSSNPSGTVNIWDWEKLKKKRTLKAKVVYSCL